MTFSLPSLKGLRFLPPCIHVQLLFAKQNGHRKGPTYDSTVTADSLSAFPLPIGITFLMSDLALKKFDFERKGILCFLYGYCLA